MKPTKKRAVIIGAGPAGLTAGLELLRRTDIEVILLEASQEIGGISRTIRYKGNRMDIGGHRFFSKSDRVMQWWRDLMPVYEDLTGNEDVRQSSTISYQGKHREVAFSRSHERASNETGGYHGSTVAEWPEQEAGDDQNDSDRIMLIRPRKSRIYFLRRFFDYPIKLTSKTLKNLGLVRTIKVGVSYIASQLHQIKPERSLEDFLINRFGRELYLTFFKSYTEKVWGTPCNQISAEWGAQRIKGLNLSTAIKHFIRTRFAKATKISSSDVAQKNVDTSLIERFMYPKFGPGQLWEHVAALILNGVRGPSGVRQGELHRGLRVVALSCGESCVESVTAIDEQGRETTFTGDYFFSTMPVRELMQSMDAPMPRNVREVGDGLQYRDFITIGLLVDRLKVNELDGSLLKDTWIYIQEPDVQLGRLQIFNNWSPYLVADPSKVWVGLEYFCDEGGELWAMEDEALKRFAIAEVAKIGLLDPGAVSDSHAVRIPKAYPAYFGTYDRFGELQTFTDSFKNLFLIGRNGMHKYNNQDHSMLTAMTVVDGLVAGHVDKAAIWSINTEQDYHEKK